MKTTIALKDMLGEKQRRPLKSIVLKELKARRKKEIKERKKKEIMKRRKERREINKGVRGALGRESPSQGGREEL